MFEINAKGQTGLTPDDMSEEQRAEQRYPCVGITRIYSVVQGSNVAGLGSALHQAALTDMSLHGLSFDVDVPLGIGQTLIVLVEQPDGAHHERLTSTVQWCRQLDREHYRVGVRIDVAAMVASDNPGRDISFPIGTGPALPISAALLCPACEKHALFQLIGQQVVGAQGDIMPLYDCTACGTTRSMTGVLAYTRLRAVGSGTA